MNKRESLIWAAVGIVSVLVVMYSPAKGEAQPVTASHDAIDIAMRSPHGNVLYLKCSVDKEEPAP